MNVKLIGCLHLGHKAIAQHRGFHDEFYHDDYLIEQWNNVVHKKDKVYILGDITMETSEHYYKLDLLNGRKVVILGNHDREQDIKELLNYVDSVQGAKDYKGCMLTHVPIHPNEVHFYRYNFHAHIHHINKLEEVVVKDRYNDGDSLNNSTLHKYINVDAHLLDYKPKTIEELINNK